MREVLRIPLATLSCLQLSKAMTSLFMVLLGLIRAYPSSEVVLGISYINIRPSAQGAIRLLVPLPIGNHLIALRNQIKNESRTQHQSPNKLNRETSHRAHYRKFHKLSRETSQKWTTNKVNLRILSLTGKSFWKSEWIYSLSSRTICVPINRSFRN
jgi:hypothetical protein